MAGQEERSEQEQIRRQKLEELTSRGYPYPNDVRVDSNSARVRELALEYKERPESEEVVAPQRRIVVVPQQHAMMAQENGMMAHGHRVFVVPGTFLVVPQTPVYYVAAPYTSCIWCDELGCVPQTLEFCAMFAGP